MQSDTAAHTMCWSWQTFVHCGCPESDSLLSASDQQQCIMSNMESKSPKWLAVTQSKETHSEPHGYQSVVTRPGVKCCY